MKLIFLGAPGAGKGTQADVVCDRLHIPTISTGNILREAMQSGTMLGKKAKSFVDAGGLVPDDVVIGIIEERLAAPDCQDGFILDGFPRTIPQAEALDKMGVEIDKVVSIEVPDDKIIERMSGRRVCGQCGASYHLKYNPPRVSGVCDKCGAPIAQRKDDAPDTVSDRLRVYHEQTEPLKDFYRHAGKLCTIEGQEEVQDTTRLMMESLGLPL